jgi:drug/metabolite transporter (DMT)-like permease
VAVIGFLFYGEALEWPIMLGAVIILAANVVNLRDAVAPQKPS